MADENGNLVENAVVAHYYFYEDYSGAENGVPIENYKSGDGFIAYTYLPNNDGVTVPVIYKTDTQEAIDSPDEFGEPDYQDIFYYEGTTEVDGVVYDKWRKIYNSSDSNLTWESDGKVWAFTNVVVNDGVDTYFNTSKLEAWELKYCLDNDTSRFA